MPAITPSPANGGGMIYIPSPNPKATKKQKATVQPIVPKAPKLKPKLPGAEKPFPMPKIINRNSGGIKSGTPGGMMVEKVYNTY